MGTLLFIIAANRPDLFEKWTAEFPELAVSHVVMLDRRRRERRQQVKSVQEDQRRAERRTHKVDRELELTGLAVVAVAVA